LYDEVEFEKFVQTSPSQISAAMVSAKYPDDKVGVLFLGISDLEK
jgi:hypothetical protein